MTKSRRALTIAGLSASLVLAACGANPSGTSGTGATVGPGGAGATTPVTGPTQDPGGPTTIDACALLPAADIKAVTGLDISGTPAPGPQSGIFPDGCRWELANPGAMVEPSMTLGILPSGGKAYYEQYFEPFNDEYGYEPIEGLGDVAVDAGAGSVLVVAGDTLFDMQYIGLTAEDVTIATELAKKVVANLGG